MASDKGLRYVTPPAAGRQFTDSGSAISSPHRRALELRPPEYVGIAAHLAPQSPACLTLIALEERVVEGLRDDDVRQVQLP